MAERDTEETEPYSSQNDKRQGLQAVAWNSGAIKEEKNMTLRVGKHCYGSPERRWAPSLKAVNVQL